MPPPPRLRELQHRQCLKFLNGEVIFGPDEAIDAIYLVESGSVVIFSATGSGPIATLGPGRIVGLRDLLTCGVWPGIGLAHWSTVLRVIEATHIRRLIDAAPIAHQQLLLQLAL